jgi:hypothetical protein
MYSALYAVRYNDPLSVYSHALDSVETAVSGSAGEAGMGAGGATASALGVDSSPSSIVGAETSTSSSSSSIISVPVYQSSS